MEAMKLGRAAITKTTLDDGKVKSSPSSGCDIPSTMPECCNFTVGFVTDTLDLAGKSKVLVANDTQIFDSLYRHDLLAFAL